MLCYDDSKTLTRSIDSILPLSKVRNIEVVVVDNVSNDGSGQLLMQFSSRGQIKYISRKCSRGLGRQIAFENSSGDYILACMDCDDEFVAENIDRLIEVYQQKHRGLVMMTKKTKKNEMEASNITIAPRDLIVEIGGWRDINWCEDWDFWARAAAVGKYAFEEYPYSYPPHKSITVRVRRNTSLLRRLVTRYNKYKDACKIGRPPFGENERVSLSQRIMYALARITLLLSRKKLSSVPNPWFTDAVYSDS